MVVWIGVTTALMAALIAIAQADIKRILAYSTVSQLGLMMVSLGVGGVAAGIMHLLAHGFFKALLFQYNRFRDRKREACRCCDRAKACREKIPCRRCG